MLNIMLMSNSPHCTSGYGQTTKCLLQLFVKLGHRPACFAFFGLEGGILNLDGIDLYPRGHDSFGNDTVWSHCQRAGSDVLISNVDTHVLNSFGRGPRPWVPLVPVMEDPLTPGIKNSLVGALKCISISRYGQRVLADAGIPSTLIPLPVPTEFYYPIDRRKAKEAMGWPANAYVIGHVGMNRGVRKGHDILLRAFQLFLAEVPTAFLYMHTDVQQPDGINLASLVRTLGLENQVRFPSRYDAFYGRSQIWMQGFYNSLDLYVQPSLNEGQGMPLWEAFSAGCVAVATRATALTEALEGADAIGIDPVNKLWQVGEGWAYEISADQLATAMLQAYRKWGHNRVSLRSRQWAVEQVSLPVIGHLWQDELLHLEKMIRFAPRVKPWASKPTVVQVSTTVQNCGIGAYTRALMAAMGEATEQKAVEVRAVQSAADIPPSDIVHWHYEPAISPAPEILSGIFRDLRQEGRLVICTYHNIDPGLINYHLEKQYVNAALVHWPLPGMQVTDPRVHILGGMGCPSFHPPRLEVRQELREQYGFSYQDLVITTFGFAAVGRGHYEVLEELAPYLTQAPHAKMQLLLPENFLNAQGRQIVHHEIQEIAKAYHIGRQVHLLTEFLVDGEVLKRLWCSDVGFLFLGQHTASSSAAIRFFTAARLATVVSPSTHFADVRLGVVRTETFSLPEFARTVWETSHNVGLRARLKQECERLYSNWSWPEFGLKILEIYRKSLNS